MKTRRRPKTVDNNRKTFSGLRKIAFELMAFRIVRLHLTAPSGGDPTEFVRAILDSIFQARV